MTQAVQQEEIDSLLDIFRTYGVGRTLGVSGLLLGTGVVTEQNQQRIRLVVDEMERRGLIRVKYPALNADHDALYEITP